MQAQDWYYDVKPEDLPESHKKFLGVLPVPEILKLCEAFGGASAYIPMNDEVYNDVVRNRGIREAYLKGVPIASIAERFHVSDRTVARVVQGYAPNQISMFDQEENRE